MAFFGEGSKFGVNIRYVKEEQALGTVGGLTLIRDEIDDAFLLINGDTLTTLNFSDLVSYHRRNRATATLALKKRLINIDFGVVEVDSRSKKVKGYVEKLTLVNWVSMGVNVLSPGALDYIEPNKYLDFPNLIQKLISNGEKVKGFMFDGYWLDIGRPEDYERANMEIEEIYSKLGIS